MPEVRVSGVPYTINVTPNFNTIQEAIDWYENQIATLERENKCMKEKLNRLREENYWLEAVNARIEQGRL